MKIVAILGAVIIIIGGYYFFAGPPNPVADAPAPLEQTETEAVNDDEAFVVEAPKEEPATSTEAAAPLPADATMEYPIPDEEAVLEAKEFTLDSFNFGYDVTEIRVQEGDTVTINLTNSEGFHDWVVDEFDAATEKIREGGLTSVTFVADKAGAYEYYCSVGSHRAQGMVGTLIVE